MIAFLTGTLVSKTVDKAYIDVAGVGYEVGMSQSGLSNLPDVGTTAHVYTYLQVREDAMTLYGFIEHQEKEIFMKLISVSGIGPKVALAALSTYAPRALIAAINSQDAAAVGRIPGVGKKTASRIVLELKDAFDTPIRGVVAGDAVALAIVSSQVTEALLSMGFTEAEAEVALQDAPEQDDEGALLRYALKRLGTS